MFNQKLKAEIASLRAELAQYKRASDNLKQDLLHWQLTSDSVIQVCGSKNESVLGSRAGRAVGVPFISLVADHEHKSKALRDLSDAINNHRHWSGSINLKAEDSHASVQLIVQPHYSAQGGVIISMCLAPVWKWTPNPQ